MDLVDRDQLGARRERGDGAAAVLVDRGTLVIAAVADIEPRQFTFRHAPAPPEKSVRQATEAAGATDFDGAHSVSRMMMSSSAWFPTMKS
jgi:hypothetical protein